MAAKPSECVSSLQLIICIVAALFVYDAASAVGGMILSLWKAAIVHSAH